MAVLSQLHERIDYADAFMAAALKLGADTYHVRLPEASTSLLGDAGAWTVGTTPLAGNDAAMDSLKRSRPRDRPGCSCCSRRSSSRSRRAGRGCSCASSRSTTSPALFPTADQRRRVEVERGAHREGQARCGSPTPRAATSSIRLGDYPVMTKYGFTDTAGPLGPLALRLPVQRRGGRRRRREGRDRRGGHHHHAVQEVSSHAPVESTIEAGPDVDTAAASTPSCCGTTSRASRTRRRTASPTSAGAATRRRAGPAWPTTAARSAWRAVRSTATRCSPRVPTRSWAGPTTRSATSTSRCATAACTSTTSR